MTHLCNVLDPRSEIVDLEAKFEPTLLNSAVYLISLSQQVSTFAVNFQGRPFREGIRENPPIYYGLLSVAGVAICGATDFIPELNRWLQLVEMDSSVRCLPPKFEIPRWTNSGLAINIVPLQAHDVHGPRLRRCMAR